MSTTHTMQMPPDVAAKIAAMPAAQQAMMQSMMGGGGQPPTVTTRQVCIASQLSVDSMINQAQQSPGMQCSVTNRVQTADGASFDISCTGQTGSAKGHTDLQRIDDDHVSSKSHITVTGSAQGKTMNSTMDSTSTAKFVSADCGSVKPYVAPPAK